MGKKPQIDFDRLDVKGRMERHYSTGKTESRDKKALSLQVQYKQQDADGDL